MKEFDYDLDYKRLDFTDQENRKLYRIGTVSYTHLTLPTIAGV